MGISRQLEHPPTPQQHYPQNYMTIKRKLLGLTITGLAFVLAISATGYWGITTVEETTAEVAATGSAIRNHVEAGVYNDMTRSDIVRVQCERGHATEQA